jgi:hypothetical protein
MDDVLWLCADGAADCWNWQGPKSKAGYGLMVLPPTPYGLRQSMNAHRYIYGMCFGEITPGNHIHHRCEVRDCVNPFHLEQVTPKQHVHRHR